MIDKTTRENAVNDVKDGMSYLKAAKMHGIDDVTVERWCRAVDVRSLHAGRRKTDDEILDAVKSHKVVTCSELSKILGCSTGASNKHLRTMVMNGKIQSYRIPSLSSAARIRRGLFTKFINTRIYYVSTDDLAMWVRSQLPEEKSMSLRKCVTQMFRGHVKIFAEV